MSLQHLDSDYNPCENITYIHQSTWKPSNYNTNIKCFYFVNNNYDQIFLVSFILILIHMGTYLMQYPLHAKFFLNFIDMKPKLKFEDIKEEWINRERIPIVEPGYIGGLPILLYFVVNAILHGIYIFIKLVLVLLTKGAYFGHPNDEFRDTTFQEFNSSEHIIEMGFFAHSILSALIVKLY